MDAEEWTKESLRRRGAWSCYWTSACGCIDSSIWNFFLLTTSLQPSTSSPVIRDIPSELGLDDFLSYFSSTWAQGFSAERSAQFLSELCNALVRTPCHLNRTNNYPEDWNRQFAVQVGHVHPTIWNFMAAVYMELITDEKFQKEETPCNEGLSNHPYCWVLRSKPKLPDHLPGHPPRCYGWGLYFCGVIMYSTSINNAFCS